MIKKNSLTLTIASNNYGYGHLKRMINFRSSLLEEKINNDIIYFDNKFFKDLKNDKKYKINDIIKKIKKKNFSFIVLDFANSFFLNSKLYKKIFNFISTLDLLVVVFDNFSKNILTNLSKLKKKILICPYIYENKFIRDKKNRYKGILIGPKYSILKKTNQIKKKKIKLRKILISCGGSDFKSLSLKLYSILKKYDFLKISIIIGAHFNKLDKFKILNQKRKGLKVYENINDLTSIVKKYDLAIITSGLTKYELLSIKMNFAVLSENRNFYNSHLPFAKKKLNYELGFYKNKPHLSKEIDKLINDYEIFFNSINHQKIIDFNGAYRIIKNIKSKL